MSHFTKLTTTIKDLEVLSQAAQKMGFRVTRNAPCRYYSGSKEKDFVINLPGKFDLAVAKSGDNYALEADWWGGHVANYVGQGGSRLMQRYAVEKAKIEAYKKGLAVTETQKNDSISLIMIDYESGGQITVECDPNGETQVRTSGFQGETCMKFRDLEEALGVTESISFTDEYYASECESATNAYAYADYSGY